MRELGAEFVVVKLLASNQDNEKNQIYLGRGQPASQLFPGALSYRGISTSKGKANSRAGSPIVELAVPFAWIWRDGLIHEAPNTKLIEYSQYPEARLSGFLSRCESPPQALRRTQQHKFGQRLLVLGVTDQLIFGSVLTSAGSNFEPIDISSLPTWRALPSLRVAFGPSGVSDPRQKLLEELRTLSRTEFPAMVLKSKGDTPIIVTPTAQSGGWTLEALLDIPRNSISAPDKYGFEIKSVRSGRVSVITTEPDFGFRFEKGMGPYLERFGRQGTAKPAQRVFSGVHTCWETNTATNCRLEITNWNRHLHSPDGDIPPSIRLLHVPSGEVVSGWTFAKIGDAWSKKHAGAMYVQTTKTESANEITFSFGPTVIVGEGTTALHFFAAVSAGFVQFDPGDRFSPQDGFKKRTQWRVSGSIKSSLTPKLSVLYGHLGTETI